MAIFKGAGVAIATPMKENLEINFDKLDEMLGEQIAGGTDAIIICGTTGESATMTEAELLRRSALLWNASTTVFRLLQELVLIAHVLPLSFPKKQKKTVLTDFFL